MIEIKAGRKQNKSHRKRHKCGPKKGEVVTSTDEDEDEENLNSSDWSDSSVDDNDPRTAADKKLVRPLLASGPSIPNTGKPLLEEVAAAALEKNQDDGGRLKDESAKVAAKLDTTAVKEEPTVFENDRIKEEGVVQD